MQGSRTQAQRSRLPVVQKGSSAGISRMKQNDQLASAVQCNGSFRRHAYPSHYAVHSIISLVPWVVERLSLYSWLALSALCPAFMAVGEGRERFIIGDTLPDVHLPQKEFTDAMATATAVLTTEHALEHAIPLKKKHHPQACFQDEREGWHGKDTRRRRRQLPKFCRSMLSLM